MTPTQRVQAGLSAVSDKFKKSQGQPGGMRSIPSQGKRDAFVNLQRQKFFGDRDVPEERVLRRTKQEGALNQFKDALVRNNRVVTGTRPDGTEYVVRNANTGEPIYLTDVPRGRSVSDVAQNLAYRFGPTPKEVAGDIGYGLSSMAKGYGIPFVSSIMRGVDAVKSTVESAWDAIRGEPTSAQGTAFPQPGSDTKDLFSSIDTGIAEVDPNNMLVQIAKANEGRFDDTPSFQEQLNKATVQNLNAPSIGDIIGTASDYVDAYQAGVNLDTPIGTVNLNPAKESIFLQNQLKNLPINYSASYTPGSDQATGGIQMALPKDFMLSGGTNFEGDGGLGLSKSYNSFIRGVNDITPYVSTNLDQSRAGVNVGFDPLAALGISSSFGVPVNFGISTDQSGNITPRLEVNAPFGGLGYMFK